MTEAKRVFERTPVFEVALRGKLEDSPCPGHPAAKFWPNPVSLARNLGFKPKELRAIERLLVENEAALLAAWQDHLGQEG